MAAGTGLSQTPVVRTRFISGPNTDSRKPHPWTSFSFKILHSSIHLVEKGSIRDFLSALRKRRKNRNTVTDPRKTAPAQQRSKQVLATISYSISLQLHFIL